MISVLRGQHQHIKTSTWRRVWASRQSGRFPSQPWAPSLRDEDCGLIYLAEWQEAERERETLPRRRYWSQLVWANTVTPAHHLTSNTGLHFTLNLYCELWLPCPNVTRQQAELHLASSRRLELLNLLAPHCSRQTISDHLPFLVQNNPTDFCTTLEVCVSPSGDWGRMLQVIFYFTETLNTPRWLQFTPCRRPGEGGGGRARLSLSRLPSQLNIPAPLHRGCAGVEQPLYPAEPTPPKVLKYIIVMRPRGPQTWLADNFFPPQISGETDWQSIISDGNINCWVHLSSWLHWCRNSTPGAQAVFINGQLGLTRLGRDCSSHQQECIFTPQPVVTSMKVKLLHQFQ